MKVLVVDDSATVRHHLIDLLSTLPGVEILEADHASEAMRAIRSGRPDVVVLDIHMPGGSGIGVLEALQTEDPRPKTIMLTNDPAPYWREACFRIGADFFFDKTVEFQQAVDVIALLAHSRATPREDPAPIDHDRLRAASVALASKVEELEASEQRMAAIVGFAQQIAAERNAHVLLDRLCAAAREVTSAQYATVTMLSDDRSACLEAVIGERRPVRVRQSLVVPIASPSVVYGSLSLRNKPGAQGFSDRDVEMALTLATHAGIAYENAQLYDDLRHRSAALEQEVADRRSAEARTELALTAIQMGVWELDLQTGRLYWSESLAAIFSLSPGQAPTTNEEFFALIHPDDRAAARDGLERSIRERTDLVHEFRTIWPDGTVHWIAGRARVLHDGEGSGTRIIGVGMDIGERKSLEEQLRQAQKMEAVGQLAGGIAHDFNNLLTVIHGHAELLLPTFSVDDRRQTEVDEIVKAADRAARLTRQLLAFSRKQVLQPTRLDVNGLVINMSEMLRRLIGEDIELATKLAPAPAPVHADAGQIEQILLNLTVNARDAMPQGGRLSIETAIVMLDDAYAMQRVAVRPGPYVMLAVADTGVGMDEQTTHRIFEPFFTTKARGHGTGLGLSTVYGIVKQSGGYVWVYSEVGGGSTFKVYLPLVEEGPVVASPTTEVKAAPRGSETVLLVEDEPALRLLCRTLLERAGYSVLDAADPRQAEDLFRQHGDRIDVLVTDVIMPGSTGPSLFSRLSVGRRPLKVLYMSGYADTAFVQSAEHPSDIMFLQKPFTAHGLLCKVREALD